MCACGMFASGASYTSLHCIPFSVRCVFKQLFLSVATTNLLTMPRWVRNAVNLSLQVLLVYCSASSLPDDLVQPSKYSSLTSSSAQSRSLIMLCPPVCVSTCPCLRNCFTRSTSITRLLLTTAPPLPKLGRVFVGSKL